MQYYFKRQPILYYFPIDMKKIALYSDKPTSLTIEEKCSDNTHLSFYKRQLPHHQYFVWVKKNTRAQKNNLWTVYLNPQHFKKR